MNRLSSTLLWVATPVLLAGCGGGDDTPASSTAPVQKPAPTTVEASTAPAPSTPEASTKDVRYRTVNARLRGTGEQVVIMVPEDIDVESGRMLEYYEGDDGKLYMRSVIPQ